MVQTAQCLGSSFEHVATDAVRAWGAVALGLGEGRDDLLPSGHKRRVKLDFGGVEGPGAVVQLDESLAGHELRALNGCEVGELVVAHVDQSVEGLAVRPSRNRASLGALLVDAARVAQQ